MAKKIFEVLFKVALLGLFSYFLVIANRIAENLENGRFQFKSESHVILDTKTGKLYFNKNGELIEKK